MKQSVLFIDLDLINFMKKKYLSPVEGQKAHRR